MVESTYLLLSRPPHHRPEQHFGRAPKKVEDKTFLWSSQCYLNLNTSIVDTKLPTLRSRFSQPPVASQQTTAMTTLLPSAIFLYSQRQR